RSEAGGPPPPRSLNARRPPSRRGAVRGDEGADAVKRVGGDAAAVAQPGGELAVIDRAPAEGRLGEAGVPAIVGNFLQQVLSVHGWASDAGVASLPSFLRLASCALPLRGANQGIAYSSTTNHPTRAVGLMMG